MTPLVALLYVLPSVVASMRGHHRTARILTINLLLGWTVVGWMFAFERAFSPIRRGDEANTLGLLFLLALPLALFLLQTTPPPPVLAPHRAVFSVPEPSTALMLGTSLLPLALYARRNRR